jgi:hypothetical protein
MPRTKVTATFVSERTTERGGHEVLLRLSQPVRSAHYGSGGYDEWTEPGGFRSRFSSEQGPLTHYVIVDEETAQSVVNGPYTHIFPANESFGYIGNAMLYGSGYGWADWRRAVRDAGWKLVTPRPPHGRRRASRQKPMSPQSAARRRREYDANVREAGKMAAAASKPVAGETAKLLLALGAALKK